MKGEPIKTDEQTICNYQFAVCAQSDRSVVILAQVLFTVNMNEIFKYVEVT